MNNDINGSEYERLIREGYTEHPIDVSFDELGRMELFDSPLAENREDKGVTVTDSTGLSMRTSSIMMGYNKQSITLENGTYVSWEEVEQLLNEVLNNTEEEVIYFSKDTGKRVEPSEIVTEIFELSTSKTYLSLWPTDKITNQQAMQMGVHDPEKGNFPKGVAMLGNDGFQLENGEYVSKVEIVQALQNYVMLKGPELVPPVVPPLTPEIPPIGPEDPVIPTIDPIKTDAMINEPVQEETHRVINDFVRKYSWIPLAVALTSEVIAGFGKTDKIVQEQVLRDLTNLRYKAAQVEKIDETFETSKDVFNRMFEGVTTGEEIEIDQSVDYYESSDHKYGGADKKGVVGEDLDFGKYEIDGFSILENGKIRDVDFDKGEDLYDKLEEVSRQTGTPIEQLEPMMHLKKSGGYDAGWVKGEGLFTDDEKKPQLKDVEVILDESNKYDGTIEDFKGDTITINNGKEDITINVKDQDGNFIKSGDIVVGSDGQQYQMTDFEVTQEEVIDFEDVKTGTKVNWSLKNITLEEHLAAVAIALVGTALSARKKKDMVDMTESQIEELIVNKKKEFIDAKGEYEGNSEFKKATETLVGKQIVPPMTAQQILKDELIAQEITVQEIRNLGEESGGKRR